MKGFVFFVVLGLVLSVFGKFAGAEELDINGDFEEIATYVSKAIIERAESLNFKLESPLILPAKWTLNLTATAKDGEFRFIQDKSQSKSGNNCIYLKGHIMTPTIFEVSAGDEVEVTFFAKNPEKSEIFFYLYGYGKTEGKYASIGSLFFKTTTESEWSEKTGKLSIPEKVNNKELNGIRIAFTNKDGAFIDNLKVNLKKATKE